MSSAQKLRHWWLCQATNFSLTIVAEFWLPRRLNRLLYTATSEEMGTGERQAVGAEWGLRTLGLCQS